MYYQKTNVVGIIALTLSIQAIILSCVWQVSFIIAVISLIISIIALALKEYKKGQAIAGICCSVTAITLSGISFLTQSAILGTLEDISNSIEDFMYYW